VVLTGARQVGKRTLVQAFARRDHGWSYRSFDDLETLVSARADPQGFVLALGQRALLDEIQRVPEVCDALRRSIDMDRRSGRFVLTSSADLVALPRIAGSLTGRMEVLTLWPLAQAELEGTAPAFIDACFAGRPDHLRPAPLDRGGLLQRALLGGYPEASSRGRDEARRRWFDGYLATLLQRDLRDLASLERQADVPRLLEAVAARTGGPLNVADLGRLVGMNQMTAQRYLALLEALFLLVRLPAWVEEVGLRLARAPKLYLSDAGLASHLLGLEAERLASRPVDAARLAETFVVTELFKLAAVSASRPHLHHLRTSTGLEVDVVMESRRHQLVGIDVKAGASVGEADFKALRLLRDRTGRHFECGVVLHAGRDVRAFGPRLWALPISALWSGPG
jgi:hypothetical protein